MSDQDDGLKLEELALAAEVSPRTVRYYVQRGLLPAPTFRGRDTAYGPEHLLRLRAIKRLQAAHLPLEVIQTALEGRDDAELEALADGRAKLPETGLGGLAEIETPGVSSSQWTRIVLAPGLELHLAGDASREVTALAERLREAAARPTGAASDKRRSDKGERDKGRKKNRGEKK